MLFDDHHPTRKLNLVNCARRTLVFAPNTSWCSAKRSVPIEQISLSVSFPRSEPPDLLGIYTTIYISFLHGFESLSLSIYIEYIHIYVEF